MRWLFASLFLLVIAAIASPSRAADEPLPQPKGSVMLTVSGQIEHTNAAGEAHFDRGMLEALGMASFTATFAMTGKAHYFEGVPLRAVLQRVGGMEQASRHLL